MATTIITVDAAKDRISALPVAYDKHGYTYDWAAAGERETASHKARTAYVKQAASGGTQWLDGTHVMVLFRFHAASAKTMFQIVPGATCHADALAMYKDMGTVRAMARRTIALFQDSAEPVEAAAVADAWMLLWLMHLGAETHVTANLHATSAAASADGVASPVHLCVTIFPRGSAGKRTARTYTLHVNVAYHPDGLACRVPMVDRVARWSGTPGVQPLVMASVSRQLRDGSTHGIG